jgi:hypothetical protein
MVVRVGRHKASNTQNPPRFDASEREDAGTERGGGKSQERFLEGSRKTSHQDTHRRVVVVCLSVSVHSGRGGVGSRRDEVVVMKCCLPSE